MKINNCIPILIIIFSVFSACGQKKVINTTATPPLKKEIRFAFDSYQIASNYKIILEESKDYLENHPQALLIIEGHTDYIGSDRYNLDLGDKRARAVKAYLVENGIDPNKVVTISFGEQRPVDLKKYSELYKDRRVSIAISDPEKP